MKNWFLWKAGTLIKSGRGKGEEGGENPNKPERQPRGLNEPENQNCIRCARGESGKALQAGTPCFCRQFRLIAGMESGSVERASFFWEGRRGEL